MFEVYFTRSREQVVVGCGGRETNQCKSLDASVTFKQCRVMSVSSLSTSLKVFKKYPLLLSSGVKTDHT